MSLTSLLAYPCRGRSGPLVLCALCACLSTAWSQDQDGDPHDEFVQLADLPAPAREAITLKTRSWTLKSVEVERDGGQTTYEAEAVSSGQTLEITVTAEGQIVAQGIETEGQESDREDADDEQDEQDENEIDDEDTDKDHEDRDMDDDDADGEADTEDGLDADHDHEGEEDGEH
jgi:hypothetical protein